MGMVGVLQICHRVRMWQTPAVFRGQGAAFERKGVRSARGGGVAAIGPRPFEAKWTRQWVLPSRRALGSKVSEVRCEKERILLSSFHVKLSIAATQEEAAWRERLPSM